MTFVLTGWLLITIIFGLISHFAVWARTGNYKPRYYSVLAFFVGSIVSGAILIFSVGWSLPCYFGITALPGKYTIIGYQLLPEEKIHLFIDIPGYGPKACFIPWSVPQANRLVEGTSETGNGMDLEIPALGGRSYGEPQMWPKPPTPEGPPKTENSQQPLEIH